MPIATPEVDIPLLARYGVIIMAIELCRQAQGQGARQTVDGFEPHNYKPGNA